MLCMNVRKDCRDAMGVTIAAGDEIAGNDDDIRLKVIDPKNVLKQIALRHNRAVMQIGNLHDLHSLDLRIELRERHLSTVDINPTAVDGKTMKTGQPKPRHVAPQCLPPAMLATPFGVF